MRNVTIAGLIAVMPLLLFQVAGRRLNGTIDGTSIALLVLAGLLAYVLVAPEYAKALLDRIEYLKVPGLGEAKLRAAEALEEKALLLDDELEFVRSLLTDAEDRIEKIPEGTQR